MNKTINALSQLDAPTFDRFIDFVHSPFFNRRDSLCKLILALKDYTPDFKHYSEQHLIDRLSCLGSPDKGQANLKKRLSDLYQLLQRFKLQLIFETHSITQSIGKQQLYADDQSYKNLEKEYLFWKEKLVRDNQAVSIDELSHLLFSARSLYTHQEYTNRNPGSGLPDEIVAHADALYYALKLKYLSNSLVKLRKIGQPVPEQNIRALIAASESLSATYPLIKFYRDLILLQTKEDVLLPEDFEGILYQFEKYIIQMPTVESTFALAKINSVGARGYHQDGQNFAPLLFRLYKLAVNKELYLSNGSISDNLYMTIVGMAALNQEFEWAASFVKGHVELIPEDRRYSAELLGMASIAFHQEEYKKAISLTSDAKRLKDPYKIHIRLLELRCQLGYHLNFRERRLKHIRYAKIAFERMIRRRKGMKPAYKKGYINFSRALYEIAKLRSSEWKANNFDQKLEAVFEEYSPLLLKDALLKQVSKARNQFPGSS